MQQHTSLFLGIIISLLLSSQLVAQESNKAAGIWNGTLETMGIKLETIFKISELENGKLLAKMDVPVQNVTDLPVGQVTVKNDSLILNIPMIMGIYKGKFVSNDTIKGTWFQGGNSSTLNLTKTGNTVKLIRPQTPKPPFNYLIEDVEYLNKKSGFKLAATLTIPKETKPCAAVVLITGSGAQDRDETIYEHKPFWVLADFLTQNGIAVLRVDDRGVGGSEGNIHECTSIDFAEDVLSGVDFLKSRNEIDPNKIGLIGHSEGGIIAPVAANKSNDISYVVLLAAPGIVGKEILLEQNKLLNKAAGFSDEMIEMKQILTKALVDILTNEPDTAKQLDRLQRTFSNGLYPMLPEDKKKAIDNEVAKYNTVWFKHFLSYDPYPTLSKVMCPVLALNGEKDLQVPAKLNLDAIRKALTLGGNTNFKTMELENLNHLFQNCTTGAASEYEQIEETFDLKVLEIINNWICETTNN